MMQNRIDIVKSEYTMLIEQPIEVYIAAQLMGFQFR